MGIWPQEIDGEKRHDMRKRIALAMVAGLSLAAAYPKIELPALAWLAPGMMLAIGMGLGAGSAFRMGYIAGLVFNLVAFYWLLYIPVPIANIVGWLALGMFLALYQGVWVWACWRLFHHPHQPMNGTTIREQFLNNRWGHQLLWTLTCAALWVALEMIRARFLSGFPWSLLGSSQYRMTPLIQMTSWTGVYGLSFLMVWFSVSLVSAGAVLVLRPARPRDWMIEILPPLFILVIVGGLGMRQIMNTPPPETPLKVALIQPSIPQTVIWDESESHSRFQELIRISEEALTNEVDLLVWPEAAVPSLFRYDTNIHMVATNLARKHKVWLVLGADDLVYTSHEHYDYYNASMLVTPTGYLSSIYRKRKLVIFGEYVPLADWFPFMRDFTSVQGDFTPGNVAVPFEMPGLDINTSVLICFEDIFPQLVWEYVTEDTDFLLNITNNGWFGESAAQWQHAANAVFRAVENRVPLIRCSNNGLTCWVDPLGRLHNEYFEGSDNVYQAGYKIVRVPVLGDRKRAQTVYNRFGDWFGWGCVAWSIFMIIGRFFGLGGGQVVPETPTALRPLPQTLRGGAK